MANRFKATVRMTRKYAPVFFFISGFLQDRLTLGRFDRLYDRIILSTHLVSFSLCLYMFYVAAG